MSDDVRDLAPEESRPEQQGMSPEVEHFAAGSAAGDALAAAETTDYKDRWLRSEAELQNYRRRAARDREESVRLAEDGVLLELIALLDDLERALAALEPQQAAEPWPQGIALMAQRVRDTLQRHGVFVIEAVGRLFDPSLHEALLEIDAPEGLAPGSVAQVVQPGYRRGERALRAARVVVARAATRA